ncbi:MAG TPA: DUF5698 domain-containing protein [Tepidisphaeraceae bacterium]|jgi:uncharacterized protein YebE (UPF0316 family)
MHSLLIALMIFSLRIADVSIGTIRVIYTVRGKRVASMVLGVFESAVWIFAISRCMTYVNQGDPWAILGWAVGFGTGTAVGITLDRWMGQGTVLMRVITQHAHAHPLRTAMMAQGFGVTALHGEGRDGEIRLLFVVAPRKRTKDLLHIIQQMDPHAFITVDPVSEAIGGYVPVAAEATVLRK